MLSSQLFGLGGKYHSRTFGSMGGKYRPLGRRAIAEKAMPSKPRQLGCRHEIYGCQAVDHGRWSQNEREPRGCILERVEGDRTRAAHDIVGVGGRNRCSAATRQSIIGPSVLEQMMAGTAKHTKALENEARAHSSGALCASSAQIGDHQPPDR